MVDSLGKENTWWLEYATHQGTPESLERVFVYGLASLAACQAEFAKIQREKRVDGKMFVSATAHDPNGEKYTLLSGIVHS